MRPLRLTALLLFLVAFAAFIGPGRTQLAQSSGIAGTQQPSVRVGLRPSELSAPLPHPSAPIRRIGHTRPGFSGLLGSSLVTSGNWAGYDVTGGGFTSVTATWTQPVVQPDALDTDSSFWVGLDGDGGSQTVEQTGTEGYSQDGTVFYDAWYEMYPADEVVISSLIINSGDVMTGSVTSDGAGHFTLTIADDTTGDSYTAPPEYSAAAQDESAEVIAEAPTNASTDDIIPLADFGTVQFTNCAFNGLPISGFDWNQIDMVSDSGATLASTSALSADGASFSVTTSGVTPTPTPTATPAPKLTLKLSGLTNGALKLGRRVTAKGTVRPLNLAGGKVTLTVQRDLDGKWPKVTAVVRTVGTAGSFTWTYKPARKGTYRVKAATAATATHAAAKTTWRTFGVD
jgi:hypothetical protein